MPQLRLGPQGLGSSGPTESLEAIVEVVPVHMGVKEDMGSDVPIDRVVYRRPCDMYLVGPAARTEEQPRRTDNYPSVTSSCFVSSSLLAGTAQPGASPIEAICAWAKK